MNHSISVLFGQFERMLTFVFTALMVLFAVLLPPLLFLSALSAALLAYCGLTGFVPIKAKLQKLE